MRRSLHLAALLLSACGRVVAATESSSVDPATLPSEAQFLAEIDASRGVRDGLTVARDAVLVAAEDAPRMRPDERVLGLDMGDVRIAYPVQHLNLVEVVEHSAAGRDLLVCWCPLCGSGVVHLRRVADRTLTFGHSGLLWQNAALLYDRETDSLWHHATGVAMAGPLRATRLAPAGATAVMTFGAWRAEHPDTLVLVKLDDPRTDVDVYAHRNSNLAFGLSIELAGAARFYPSASLTELEAVEDEVASVPVVVVRDAAAATTLAFDRRVDGAVLSFDVEKGVDARPLLRERGGRRAWFLRSGRRAPADAGAALVALSTTPYESNAWTLQHPTGTTWRRR